MEVRSAVGTRCALPLGRFLALVSVWGWVNPMIIVRLEGLGKLNTSRDLIGIRNCDLPSGSLAPEAITLQRAPSYLCTAIEGVVPLCTVYGTEAQKASIIDTSVKTSQKTAFLDLTWPYRTRISHNRPLFNAAASTGCQGEVICYLWRDRVALGQVSLQINISLIVLHSLIIFSSTESGLGNENVSK
jgi:hypothetical protein